MKKVESHLRNSRLGQLLTEDEISKALTGLHERAYSNGAHICMKGEPAQFWIGVINGQVKIISNRTSGKTTTLAHMRSGGWFGEGSMLKREPLLFDAIAVGDTNVALMNYTTFHWLLDNSIQFNRYVIAQLNERLGQFIGTVESDRLLDPNTRIARCLVSQFERGPYPSGSHDVKISQEELGNMAGISRQRTNKALHVLKRKNFLSMEYGCINVLNIDGLRRFGNQEILP